MATVQSFQVDLNRFSAKFAQQRKDVFTGCADAIKSSIKEGSATTGAPGQPTDTTDLRETWQIFPDGPTALVIATHAKYAVAVEEAFVQEHYRGPYVREDGTPVRRHHVRGHPMTFKNHGPHSVKLTRVNFDRLLANVVAEVRDETNVIPEGFGG